MSSTSSNQDDAKNVKEAPHDKCHALDLSINSHKCSLCHMTSDDMEVVEVVEGVEQPQEKLTDPKELTSNPPCSICQTRDYDYKLRFHRGGDTLCSKACFKIHTEAFVQQLKEQRAKEATMIPVNYHNVSSGGPCC